MTASEAFDALDAGATGLKLFPTEIITPAVLKAELHDGGFTACGFLVAGSLGQRIFSLATLPLKT